MKKKLSIKDKIKAIQEYADELEEIEKIRNINMKFSLNEIHDLHMALRECITYHSENPNHRKEHKNKCPYCHNYRNLYKRISRRCNCIENHAKKKPKKKVKKIERDPIFIESRKILSDPDFIRSQQKLQREMAKNWDKQKDKRFTI